MPRVADALELGRRAQDVLRDLCHREDCVGFKDDLTLLGDFVALALHLIQERSVLERRCSRCDCPVLPGTGLERDRQLTPMCIACQARVFGEVTFGNRTKSIP